jgi:hypothetical protein
MRAGIVRGAAWGAAWAVALAAAPAAAQLADNDDGPPLRGGMLSTQISQGRTWAVTFNVNSLSDSNLRRTSGPDPQSATRISPSVSFSAGLPVGQQQLYIGGNYGRDFTINNPEFNRSRWSIGGGAGWRLGTRCSGVIGAEAAERLNLVFDQAIFTPNSRRTTVLSANANCQTSGGLGFNASIGRSVATNDRPQQAIFDVKTLMMSANVTYGNQSLGQFSLGGSLNQSEFSQRFIVTPDGIINDGFDSASVRFGYSRALGTRMQLTAGISYLQSQPDPEVVLAITPDGQIVPLARESFTGSGYDLSLSYNVSTRLNVSVGGSRNIQASPNAGARFTLQEVYFGNVSYQLGSSMSLSGGINHRIVDYKDAFASPGEPLARLGDVFTRIYGGINYNPKSLYSLGLQLAYNQRRSDPSLYDFNSFTALVTLSVRLGKG